MGSRLLPIFAILLIAVVVSHAALPSEVYWDKVLPNTPMPKAVRELLRPDLEEEKSTSVNVGKAGVAVDSTKFGKSGTNVNVGKGDVAVNAGKPGGKGTSVTVGGKSGVNVNTEGKNGGGTSVNVDGRKGGVGVLSTRKHGEGPSVRFKYAAAASEDQLHADPKVTLFFLEKDLKSGTKMNLHFTRTTNGARFLPRKVAEAIPLSSNKFPEVLKQFSVEPQSMEAEAMKQTVKECEEPAQEDEEKSCATSLESMVDFSTSMLGKHVQPLSTEIDKQETPKQKYIIAPGVKKMGGENSVVCHKQTYAYAVFYCHKTKSTEAYKVPLVGADGTKATAVAVCHTDTSKWNPKHLAFQVLKVKPGTVPICHFLLEDHIVWTSN